MPSAAYRVLVVERHPAYRFSLEQLLSEAGYHTTTAVSFEDGRRLLEDEPPDLLVSALRLAEFNGLHLALRGRADRPEMAAIVTLNPEDRGMWGEASRLGIACLVTPVTSASLLALAAEVLSARAPVCH